MITRSCGAFLGLLAFSITLAAGLVVGNPPTVTLSRSLFALFIFFGLGLVLGAAAQAVIREQEHRGTSEIRERNRDGSPGAVAVPDEDGSQGGLSVGA